MTNEPTLVWVRSHRTLIGFRQDLSTLTSTLIRDVNSMRHSSRLDASDDERHDFCNKPAVTSCHVDGEQRLVTNCANRVYIRIIRESFSWRSSRVIGVRVGVAMLRRCIMHCASYNAMPCEIDLCMSYGYGAECIARCS